MIHSEGVGWADDKGVKAAGVHAGKSRGKSPTRRAVGKRTYWRKSVVDRERTSFRDIVYRRWNREEHILTATVLCNIKPKSPTRSSITIWWRLPGFWLLASARLDEIKGSHRHQVYEKANIEECYETTGKATSRVRWLDTRKGESYKGEEKDKEHRGRLVAQEMKNKIEKICLQRRHC